jgi:hypothetical protein
MTQISKIKKQSITSNYMKHIMRASLILDSAHAPVRAEDAPAPYSQ